MAYTIPDEPSPSAFTRFVVEPTGPLLATMLCGAWLAWPWFMWNAIALGSPTRRKEIAMCCAAIAGTAVLAMIVLALLDAGIIESTTEIRLAALAIASWKLGMAYAVCRVQTRASEVYRYYGGVERATLPILLAGFYLRPIILGLSDDPIWRIIVAGGV